jgi:hypothetical protein
MTRGATVASNDRRIASHSGDFVFYYLLRFYPRPVV